MNLDSGNGGPKEIIRAVSREVTDFSGGTGAGQTDDITMLCLEAPGR